MKGDESLPQNLIYCYKVQEYTEDLVMEGLISPFYSSPFPGHNIIYASVPSELMLALYLYRGDDPTGSKRYKLPNFRIFNTLNYLAANPLTRFGDVKISLAIPHNYEIGTPFLPISRSNIIYRLNPNWCKWTLHAVHVATALRATRQNIDAIVSMITSTLTLLSQHIGDEKKLKLSLEGLLQSYLSKAYYLASSKIRAQVQEIARVVDITNEQLKSRFNQYLSELRKASNPDQSHEKIEEVVKKILADKDIMESILGRIYIDKPSKDYYGTLPTILNSLRTILNKQARDLCDKIKYNIAGIAYGVTGQFSIYDIMLTAEITKSCGLNEETHIVVTPETLFLFMLNINILRDLGIEELLMIEKDRININLNTHQIKLIPILLPYTEPILWNTINKILKEKSILLLNPPTVATIS